jgi:hypothetical protein
MRRKLVTILLMGCLMGIPNLSFAKDKEMRKEQKEEDKEFRKWLKDQGKEDKEWAKASEKERKEYEKYLKKTGKHRYRP